MIKKIVAISTIFGVRKFLSKIYRFCLRLKRLSLQFLDSHSSGPKALILVYHRVIDLESDPLLLAVSTKNFEDQLVMLRDNFEVLSLPDLVDRISDGCLKGNEVAITFDDGYKDNLTHALPVAKRLGVPMTIFISTGILSKALPFPWDTLYSNTRESYLSQSDIETLSREPLITLGGHTQSHPRLSDLSAKDQFSELAGSKKILEGIIGKPVEYFAYPFGDYPDIDASAIRNVVKTSYRAAFSNVQRMATNRSSLLKIPRILARNWSSEEMQTNLRPFIKRL